jgi:hypothetical protein
MKRVSRFLSPWKVLIAVVAIAASAPSAKADIFLEVVRQGVGGGTAFYDLTTAGATSSGTALNITNGTNGAGLNMGAQTISVFYAIPLTGSRQSLSMTATVNSDGFGANYNFRLLSSSVTNPSGFTQGQATAPGGVSFTDAPSGSGGTGLFTSPGSVNSPSFLSSSLSGVTYSGNSGFTLIATSGYYGYGTNNTASNPGGGVFDNVGATIALVSTPGGVAGLSANGTPVAVGPRATSYDLASVDTTVSFNAGSTLTFTSTAALSLPEPSGVIAAFAGLPCVGMLLGYARRLRGRPAPEAAA